MGVHNEYAQIGSQIPWFALNSETFLNLPFLVWRFGHAVMEYMLTILMVDRLLKYLSIVLKCGIVPIMDLKKVH